MKNQTKYSVQPNQIFGFEEPNQIFSFEEPNQIFSFEEPNQIIGFKNQTQSQIFSFEKPNQIFSKFFISVIPTINANTKIIENMIEYLLIILSAHLYVCACCRPVFVC